MPTASTRAASSDLQTAEKGRAQSTSQFTTAELTTAIHDLRAVANPDTCIEMMVRVVVHHGLDNSDVVALALAEVERARCSTPVRQAALAQLQPRPLSLWPELHDTAPKAPVQRPQTDVEMRLDPELGRLAIGLHSAAYLRLWVIGRHVSTKRHSGRGWLDLSDFWAALAPLGVTYTRRHYRRLLRAGEGIFWTTTHNRIYFTGVGKVAERLTQSATRQQLGLVATNRPGGLKDVYLPVDGMLERWESLIYAGWLAAKGDPIIARDTLSALFGRTAKTIRQWERDRLQAIVTHRPCYAQVADPQANAAVIPAHSYAYVARTHAPGQWQTKHEVRIRWRLPNTYMSAIRQHPRRGQSHKVRTITNAVLELQPPDGTAGGMRRNSRRYFENAKQLRRLVRRYGTGQGERYLFLGRDRCDHNLFEPTQDGYPGTQVNERLKPVHEQRALLMV